MTMNSSGRVSQAATVAEKYVAWTILEPPQRALLGAQEGTDEARVVNPLGKRNRREDAHRNPQGSILREVIGVSGISIGETRRHIDLADLAHLIRN